VGRVRSRAGRPTNSVKVTPTVRLKTIGELIEEQFLKDSICFVPDKKIGPTREQFEEAKADLIKIQARYNDIKWRGGFE
jgi:hypothetical protein